jgi:hypothetical protein
MLIAHCGFGIIVVGYSHQVLPASLDRRPRRRQLPSVRVSRALNTHSGGRHRSYRCPKRGYLGFTGQSPDRVVLAETAGTRRVCTEIPAADREYSAQIMLDLAIG